jgi:DNA-binding transcriptional MerR regulator
MEAHTSTHQMTPLAHGVKIGELARRLGLTARALRYWEERRLVPPARRSPGGTRLYGEDHARCVRGIQRLKRAGFSLDQIEQMQQGLREEPSALRALGSLNEALLDRERQLRDRIQEQQALIAELDEARRSLSACDGCDGRGFGAECIECLHEQSRRPLPDCLHGALEGAALASTSTSPPAP